MSNSKIWKLKKKELAEKESLLLEDLNSNSAKAKKIALWSLAAGSIALIGYGIFRSFSDEKPKKEKVKTKRKKSVPKDSPVVDSAIDNLAPTVGKWILKQLRD